MVQQAESAGYKVTSSVSGLTQFLCIGPSAGPKKLQTAHEKGIHTISKEEFSELLAHVDVPDRTFKLNESNQENQSIIENTPSQLSVGSEQTLEEQDVLKQEQDMQTALNVWRQAPELLSLHEVEYILNSDDFISPEPPNVEQQRSKYYEEVLNKSFSAFAATIFWISVLGATCLWYFGTWSSTNIIAASVLVIGFLILFLQPGSNRKQLKAHADAQWPSLEQQLLDEYAAKLRRYQELESSEKHSFHVQVRKLADAKVSTLKQVANGSLASLEYPFEVFFECSCPDKYTMQVVVHLPKLDDVVPNTKIQVLKSGKIKEVRRAKKERLMAWRSLVFGLAVQSARTVLASIPTLKYLKVAAYRQIDINSSVLGYEWVYEVEFSRAYLMKIDMSTVDSVDVIKESKNRLNTRASGELKKVDAPEWAQKSFSSFVHQKIDLDNRYPRLVLNSDNCGYLVRDMSRPLVFVSDKKSLVQCCAQISLESAIGLDVETSWGNKELCLVQIAAKHKTYIIDPLKARYIELLKPIFGNKDIVKVIHHASFERNILGKYNVQINNVVDTVLVSRAKHGKVEGGHNLAAVCEREFGIYLDKDEQRTNWKSRPLSEAQIHYAALDAEILLVLFEHFGYPTSTDKRKSV